MAWIPAAIAAGTAVAGGIAGTNATNQQQSFAADSATTAYDRQVSFRRTAYQDTTQDMQAAGLNPMLAYTNGATSAAGVNMASSGGSQAVNSQAANSAITASIQAAYQLDKTKAETENIRAQTETERNRPENVRTDTSYKSAMSDLSKSQRDVADNTVYKIAAEVRNLDEVNDKVKAETKNLGLTSGQIQAMTRQIQLVVREKNLDMPRRENESAMHNSAAGKYIPWAEKGLKLTNSAADIFNKITPRSSYSQRDVNIHTNPELN